MSHLCGDVMEAKYLRRQMWHNVSVMHNPVLIHQRLEHGCKRIVAHTGLAKRVVRQHLVCGGLSKPRKPTPVTVMFSVRNLEETATHSTSPDRTQPSKRSRRRENGQSQSHCCRRFGSALPPSGHAVPCTNHKIPNALHNRCSCPWGPSGQSSGHLSSPVFTVGQQNSVNQYKRTP
jgi:hypothetical protein